MSKRQRLLYFYLNGNLHKKLQINRGADTIMTWCYPLEKRVAYTYSDVRKNMKPTFSTKEVASMLMKSRMTVELALMRGDLAPPQFSYTLDEKKRKYKYFWSEEDVLRAHAYFLTVHRGRPRSDGQITPQKMPSARELRAMMRNDEVTYIKRDGKFVPVWDAEDFS